VTVELVERARSGDREAFNALAKGSYNRLYAISRRILRDGPSAEDAVQETLIKAWRDLRALRDPSRFDAWMNRLLVRACHDQGRRSRRFSAEVALIDIERADPRDDFADVAQRDELDRAFLRLSIEHRAVLVLTQYVGLTEQEVADVLGVPRGTVASRLHYGIRAMRDALATPQNVGNVKATREVGR
jgi:RNA polymerase sigma-70 factor (ECF subfamily)